MLPVSLDFPFLIAPSVYVTFIYYTKEKFVEIKHVTRSRNSKKDRQHNDQKGKGQKNK
jgi:hypothetical protein